MEHRILGRSGLRVSSISFGAGPISGLMVSENRDAQHQTVGEALQLDVNWFDTAATYGNGASEIALGDSLGQQAIPDKVHVATKVRLSEEQLNDIPAAVSRSLEESLRRLGRGRITLLQLHNSVTTRRGDLPTSLDVRDVLDKNGVAAAFEKLRGDGRVAHFGFTGLGDRRSLAELIHCGLFTSAQIPLSILTPLAGRDKSAGSVDVDYERLVDDCAANQIGVIAVRVFAGGALVGGQPSPYTHKTKFFTLELFQRDRQRAAELLAALPADMSPAEATIRFVLGRPGVTTALIGFANPGHVRAAVAHASRGPLEEAIRTQVAACAVPGQASR